MGQTVLISHKMVKYKHFAFTLTNIINNESIRNKRTTFFLQRNPVMMVKRNGSMLALFNGEIETTGPLTCISLFPLYLG